MSEKSIINLCECTGIDAASAVVDMLYQPDKVTLCIGGSVLEKITAVSHFRKDGQPIVTGRDSVGKEIMFSFVPDFSQFSSSAVDADGKPICPEVAEQISR